MMGVMKLIVMGVIGGPRPASAFAPSAAPAGYKWSFVIDLYGNRVIDLSGNPAIALEGN